MRLLAMNLFSILCVSGAFYLMLQSKEGWGWLIFASLLGLHVHSSSNKDAKRERNLHNNSDGYTVVELICAIGILGVLSFGGFLLYVGWHFVAKFW